MTAVLEGGLTPPARRAFLSAEEAEAIVGPLRHAVALLQERLVAAEAEAAAQERMDQAARTDEAAVEEAHAAAAAMRTAAEREAARALELARAQASARLADAKAEAQVILAGRSRTTTQERVRPPAALVPRRPLVTSPFEAPDQTSNGDAARGEPFSNAIEAPPLTMPDRALGSTELPLEPVVVDGPSGENTWRVPSEASAAGLSLGAWVRADVFLPMIAAVMLLIVVLAFMG